MIKNNCIKTKMGIINNDGNTEENKNGSGNIKNNSIKTNVVELENWITIHYYIWKIQSYVLSEIISLKQKWFVNRIFGQDIRIVFVIKLKLYKWKAEITMQIYLFSPLGTKIAKLIRFSRLRCQPV